MVILVGAGGMAIDAISFFGFKEDIEIYDDNKIGNVMGFEIVGNIDKLIERYQSSGMKVYSCIGSAGDNRARNQVYEKLTRAGVKVSPLILSSFVSRNVRFGNNVLANIGSQIHHDCVIEDNVAISPGVILCGGVHVGENTFLGCGCAVIQNVNIGANSIIAAGAVVTKNVPPNVVYAGVPARFLKHNKYV